MSAPKDLVLDLILDLTWAHPNVSRDLYLFGALKPAVLTTETAAKAAHRRAFESSPLVRWRRLSHDLTATLYDPASMADGSVADWCAAYALHVEACLGFAAAWAVFIEDLAEQIAPGGFIVHVQGGEPWHSRLEQRLFRVASRTSEA